MNRTRSFATAFAGLTLVLLAGRPAVADNAAPKVAPAQVEELFLADFQTMFAADDGKVRIVALLAPS